MATNQSKQGAVNIHETSLFMPTEQLKLPGAGVLKSPSAGYGWYGLQFARKTSFGDSNLHVGINYSGAVIERPIVVINFYLTFSSGVTTFGGFDDALKYFD